jgi:hypothetical protein
MNIAQNQEVHISFTSEQRHVLGMLYGFLIQLGQQRLRRLEREGLNQEKQVGNPCEGADTKLLSPEQ